MRNVCGRLVVVAWLATASTLASTAKPDTPERLFGQRPVEGFSLLLNPSVQKDLRMSRGQVLRITARDQAAEGLLDGVTSAPDAKEIATLTKKQEEIREKALTDVLSRTQQTRLLQILAQQQGAALLLKREMEQELKLGESQRYALYAIHQDTIKKVKELPAEAPGDRISAATRQAKLRKIRQAGFNHMLRVLTPEQRKRYRALLGPPVAVD